MTTQYTPMMTHYLEIKKAYPDTLVFYRLGDFYEMFFDDAKTASHELDLVLTGRNAGAEERGALMKVVVVRSPRALRGILRWIFGIKKEDVECKERRYSRRTGNHREGHNLQPRCDHHRRGGSRARCRWHLGYRFELGEILRKRYRQRDQRWRDDQAGNRRSP